MDDSWNVIKKKKSNLLLINKWINKYNLNKNFCWHYISIFIKNFILLDKSLFGSLKFIILCFDINYI